MDKSSHGSKDEVTLSYMPFLSLALIVGFFSGLAAVCLKYLIALLHNLFFFGNFSFIYHEIMLTEPSPFGPWIIFMPVIGAFFVTWLVENVSRESKGHGVPQVMYAIHYNKGIIRPIVAFVKAIGASITIGSGGSAGREGPIIQITGAIGSTVGQIFRLSARQKCMLVAAGAAAGLAVTFNAPIGGLLFAIELLLVSINAISIAAVATSTVTACLVGYFFFGTESIFTVSRIVESASFLALLKTAIAFIPFGIFIGISSYLFIELLYVFERFHHKTFKNPYARHMIGMFFAGVIFYLMLVFFGHYYVEGLGYALIQTALKGGISSASLFFILFAAKMFTTSLTLGSGGSGGVFLPSLVMGACLGGGYGYVFNALFPGHHIPEVLFIVAGMGGMISGTAGAVMTAIVMMPEITQDFYHTIPNMITAVIAYGVRSLFIEQSIYTVMLHRDGYFLPHGLHRR